MNNNVETIQVPKKDELTESGKSIITNSYSTLLLLLGLSLLAAITMFINTKIIPTLINSISLPKVYKFRDIGLICGYILEALYKYGAYKIIIVIFHDFDRSGNPTKYTITNQISINNTMLPKHEIIKDIPFSYILPEVEHMRVNNGEHYCNINDPFLSKRFKQFMQRHNITAHYSYLMHDPTGGEVGCIYIDCNIFLDEGIYNTNLHNYIQILEAKIVNSL